MKYVFGISNNQYEKIKDINNITIGLIFIPEHRNLFIGDTIDLVYDELKTSYLIKSIKYCEELNDNVILLQDNKDSVFTVFELLNVYGE